MMRLDRYLMGGFVRYFLYSTAAFFILYVAVSLFDELNVWMRYNASAYDASVLLLARAPYAITQALPVSTLLAVVATLTIMTRGGETTAMRASGISLGRIARPFLLCGVAVTVLHLALQELVVPAAQSHGQMVRTVRIMKKPMQTLVRESNFWFRFGGAFVHADRMKPEEKAMEGVTVYEREDGAVKKSITADSARWTGGKWVLKNARVREFPGGGGWREETLPELPYPVFIPPEDLSVVIVDPQFASMSTLGERIQSLAAQGSEVTSLKVEYWKKLILPLASILMPLLAIPFAIRSTHRTGVWGGVALSVVMGFIYLSAVLAGASMGKVGTVPPWLSVWLGNLLFLPVAWLLLRRAERGV